MFIVLYTKSVGGHSRTSEKVWMQFETAELAHNFMVSRPENNYVVIEGEAVTLSAKVEVKRPVKLRGGMVRDGQTYIVNEKSNRVDGSSGYTDPREYSAPREE